MLEAGKVPAGCRHKGDTLPHLERVRAGGKRRTTAHASDLNLTMSAQAINPQQCKD